MGRESGRGASDITREFVGAELGDARLSRRLASLSRDLAADPSLSFPTALDPAALEGAYRFFNNKAVQPDAILGPHVRESVARAGDRTVVVAHDTTVFVYGAGAKRRDLGSHYTTQQFFGHVSLAITADEAREPLGVLAVHPYVRTGKRDGQQQRRWFDQMVAVDAIEGLDRKRLVHVADCEADDYSAIARLESGGYRFVLRCSDDRLLARDSDAAPRTLSEALSAVRATTTREVSLSPRGTAGRSTAARKRHPARAARVAAINIGATSVSLRRPVTADAKLPKQCRVNVVHAWEPAPPDGEAPIVWTLYTTEPIETLEQLLAIVDMYRARWRIEEFFKALKTGCAFQERQLESFDSLTRALAVFLPIAWRLLHLRTQAQADPDAPANTIVADDELVVLRAIGRTKLPRSPSRRDVMLGIAALGGHSKYNGEPGWQTLSRGLDRLLSTVEGFRLARTRRPRRKGVKITDEIDHCDQS